MSEPTPHTKLPMDAQVARGSLAFRKAREAERMECIRVLAVRGLSQRQIAEEMGVSPGCVGGICRRFGIRTTGTGGPLGCDLGHAVWEQDDPTEFCMKQDAKFRARIKSVHPELREIRVGVSA